jgi:hypothetical protein
VSNVRGEPLVPCPRCLLQTIERFLEKADMVKSRRVDEARRLLTVDRFVQVTMKKAFFTSNWWIGQS